MIYQQIENLLYYAEAHLELNKHDKIYIRNKLFNILEIEPNYLDYLVPKKQIENMDRPDEILNKLLLSKNDLTTKELNDLSDVIMDTVSLKPSEVINKMASFNSTESATNWFYEYQMKQNYVKKSAIEQNIIWQASETKGSLEVTINLSKPEKSPEEIKKALTSKVVNYPKCAICLESEGYFGNETKDSKNTLRTIPITLGNEGWFWQFSPYSYYEQHVVIINNKHIPMKVDKSTFIKLFDFVDLMPHYFIGANAALPIIGGSIMTHDHFQGGKHTLPMHKAKIKTKLFSKNYQNLEIGILDWYNNVVTIRGKSRADVIELGNEVFENWRNYFNEEMSISSRTNNIPHHSVTPIARLKDGIYILDLILRNNQTSDEHPDGIYHAHKEYHHIKKEGIGLIEAMGMFILPPRLKRQLTKVQEIIENPELKISDDIVEFTPIINELRLKKPQNVDDELRKHIAFVCENILDNTAIFKQNNENHQKELIKFLKTSNITKKL